MRCDDYTALTDLECRQLKRLKSLFSSITSAIPATVESLEGSERFPIVTALGLRTLTLGEYAQAIGGGGGGGVPSHSLAEHNNVQGNPQNGDVLVYNNGYWGSQALGGSSGWNLTGNFGTDPSIDFIGTTDNKPFIIRTNGLRTAAFNKSSVALGLNALPAMDTADPDMLYTIAIGQRALGNAPAFGSNTAIGVNAMQNYGILITPDNLILGHNYVIVSVGDTDFTLVGAYNNTPGTTFTATGSTSGTGTVSGYATNTVAVGPSCLWQLQEGHNNVSIGEGALGNLVTGRSNLAFGTQAGIYTQVFNAAGLETADYSIFIGEGTKANYLGETNQIVIGYQAVGLGSNTIVLGNNNIVQTALKGNVTIGTTTTDASARLQIDSVTQGFLPPRMTGAQAEAITSPAEGLMIYSTDGTGVTITSKGWWGFDGSAWNKLN